jgi:hypothetical protein
MAHADRWKSNRPTTKYLFEYRKFLSTDAFAPVTAAAVADSTCATPLGDKPPAAVRPRTAKFDSVEKPASAPQDASSKVSKAISKAVNLAITISSRQRVPSDELAGTVLHAATALLL